MIRQHIQKYIQKYYIFFSFAIFIFLLYSCNITKKVPDGQYLLTQNKFKYLDKKLLNGQIPNFVVQKPNRKELFFIPFGLMMYNLSNPQYDEILTEYQTYPSQMRNQKLRDSLFVKYGHPEYIGKSLFWNKFLLSIGQPPVILDESKTQKSAQNIRQYLVYKGYWDAKVNYLQNLNPNHKKASVEYQINFGTPTLIKDYFHIIPDSQIRDVYERNLSESRIKKGQILDQADLEEESQRITDRMRDEGFYTFNRTGEEIFFVADSLKDRKNVPLFLEIHKDSLDTPYKKTTIGNVDLYVVHNLKDTINTKIKKAGLLNDNDSIKIHLLDDHYSARSLWLPLLYKHGDFYKQKKIDYTKRNLLALNNFSVNTKLSLRKSPNDSILDIRYILTPLPKYELKTSFDTHYSQILNVGFTPSIELVARNVFGGAENLSTNFSGIVGTTKNGKNPNKKFNAYELSAQVKFNAPRFFIPINYYYFLPKSYTPTSAFVVGASIQNNIGMDRINFNAGLTYSLLVNDRISHHLTLFNTLFSLTKNKDRYYDYFTEDNNIRESLYTLYSHYNPQYQLDHLPYDVVSKHIISDNQFINSLNGENRDLYNTFIQSLLNKERQTQDVVITSLLYNYNYNESNSKYYRNPFYFNGKFEISGNLLNSFTKKYENENVLGHAQKTIFKIPFSQFVKFDLDFRKYFNFYGRNGNKSTLALRQFVGLGIPYGNSSSMPFVRSYFNGGSNDIRAWVAFGGLGPSESLVDEKIRAYTMGNIKLTTTAEYRFPITKMFEGALFTDIGNIWTLKNKDSEDDFKFNKFYKEMGVGSGFGVRINIAYMILRVDFAYKLYNPNVPEGTRWFNHFKVLKPTLNFAFGYPF